MSKLAVLLDSEHYTDVIWDVFDGDDVSTMTKLVDDEDLTLTEHTPEGRFLFELEGGIGLAQYHEWWYVGQVFEIQNPKFILVFHHAYDGVDFELLGQFDSIDDAIEARDKSLKERLDDSIDSEDLEMWDGDRQAVFDTGDEWWVWTILEVSQEEGDKKNE